MALIASVAGERTSGRAFASVPTNFDVLRSGVPRLVCKRRTTRDFGRPGGVCGVYTPAQGGTCRAP